ncbi:unnamed protein product [Adineta steineri]|uniref:CUB domain-containing protein n=1 Tax=Adineta steineri TaxID=433720 RepID=A0A819TPL6_9BILA|nr:unnamed protein product [Adineta steineri]CAF4076617.1 unnamed protein product [Adineta steineri]
MTSANIDGIKRSNVCGEGYRIEGVLLKSYPYSTSETYLPYEDCLMSFQARRSNNQIRIRILTLDLNDIHAGTDCLDSLRFYKSVHMKDSDKLDSVECGQLNETNNFSFISPTGIVTAHFTSDGGNVNGLGFRVVLTSFRSPNKTHPCDSNDEEFPCENGDCISSLLLCDGNCFDLLFLLTISYKIGIEHCLDGSDESTNLLCNSNNMKPSKQTNIESKPSSGETTYQQWRGILILIFFFIIFLVFALFIIYFLCRRCYYLSKSSITNVQRRYSTMVNTPLNVRKQSTTTTTRVITQNSTRLDADYNLL